MDINRKELEQLITRHVDRIEEIIAGTGYKAKKVIGVATFLLDNDLDIDLLTAKQQATFDKFLKPLLEKSLT